MDHIEMVEKLREKTGLSYEEARAALERADWNLLDALIALEREGKSEAGQAYTPDETVGEAGSDANSTTVNAAAPSFRDQLRKAWRWIVKMFHKGNRNYLCMEKGGRRHFELPVTLAVILLLAMFWLCIVLMIVALLCGCKFRFTGPDLGTEKVNSVMDKASEVADSIKSEFRSDANNGNNNQ